MTRRRLSVALVVVVLLGTPWADAAAQTRAATVAALRQQAEQGDAIAQHNLAVMYQSGQGVPQDFMEAVAWYRKAAAQGYADAQSALGFMYDTGQGVPQYFTEAVAWYRKAAAQGYADGQYNLGHMYFYGRGVPQSYVEARKWLNLAAARATSDDQKRYAARRDEVATLMTPAQVAEAQQLAREWQAAFDARQE